MDEKEELWWYLAELCEAVETLADRHGYEKPQCLPFAKAVVKKYDKGETECNTHWRTY